MIHDVKTENDILLIFNFKFSFLHFTLVWTLLAKYYLLFDLLQSILNIMAFIKKIKFLFFKFHNNNFSFGSSFFKFFIKLQTCLNKLQKTDLILLVFFHSFEIIDQFQILSWIQNFLNEIFR